MWFANNVIQSFISKDSEGDSVAVLNNICEQCDHSGVCKIEDEILVFSEFTNKPLGVDIEIKGCKNYKEIC